MPNTGGPLVISRGSPSTTPAPRSRGDGQGVEHAHSWYFAVAVLLSDPRPGGRLRGGAARARARGDAGRCPGGGHAAGAPHPARRRSAAPPTRGATTAL